MVLTSDEAIRIAEEAVQVAKVAAAMTTRRIGLAPEPVHDDVTWVSAYDINPLEVPIAEKVAAARRLDRPAARRTRRRARHREPPQVQENKFYADLAGTPPPSSGSG